MLGPTPAGKKVWQRLQVHALPLRNLDGMDPIVCGKLIDRPFPTDRLESHFRLERTTVLPSLCRHLLVLPHGSMSLTYSVVQFLGSIILLTIGGTVSPLQVHAQPSQDGQGSFSLTPDSNSAHWYCQPQRHCDPS